MSQRHGCIIVDPSNNNKIVCSGFNFKMSYLQHQFSIHAEASALTRLKKITRTSSGNVSYDMYVVRIGADATLKMSKPCCACTKAIQDVKKHSVAIRRVYFSFS